jgi:hypothetical protein
MARAAEQGLGVIIFEQQSPRGRRSDYRRIFFSEAAWEVICGRVRRLSMKPRPASGSVTGQPQALPTSRHSGSQARILYCGSSGSGAEVREVMSATEMYLVAMSKLLSSGSPAVVLYSVLTRTV